MWIFIILLAAVPLVFYWSDSAQALFPQLAQYLPQKGADKNNLTVDATPHKGPDGQAEEPGRWYTTRTDKGYVSWALSADGVYRIATGCRANAPASLQVTHNSGKALGPGLFLNYEYGTLELGAGAYAGPDLTGAVAQFQRAYLQTPQKEVLAEFDFPASDSGLVARALQTDCAASPAN